MKMRYILGLLLLPGAAMAQSTTQLIDKTTGAWLSPSAALVKSGNAAGWSFTAPNIGAATGTSLVCPTLNGGTAANDDIRIQGTTNATRATSYVTLQENGGLVGIGTATPTGLLHVVGSLGNTIIGSTGEAFTTTRGAHTAFFGTGGSGGLMGTTTNSPFSIFVNNSTTALTAATTGIITFPIGVTVGAVSFSGITADPNADRISFWDDSAGSVQWLSLSGLTITGTTLAVDAATDSVAGKVELATSAETIAGTSNSLAVPPSGLAAYNLGTQLTTVGNVGTGEDTLWSQAIGANTLSTNGQAIHAILCGVIETGATPTLRIKFGATELLGVAPTVSAGDRDWSADVWIIRTGAATQRAVVTLNIDGDVDIVINETSPTETLSGSVNFVVTGQGTSDNDITLFLGKAVFEQ